jgi:putative aldouronate transport system permease protein
MVERNSRGDLLFLATDYVLVTLVCALCLYPMVHVLFASISDPIRLMQHTGVMLWPEGFSLKGYSMVFANPNILTGYWNTFIYTTVGTSLNLLMSMLGAYALSRRDYPGKTAITLLIVFTMYFSGGLIPHFLLVKNLGMFNSRLALIIPPAINTWNLIVMRTSFRQIPDSLEESAKMDGANDFVILFRIFMPVAKATLAVMALFYAVAHWNSWFSAMIFLQERALYPLQLFLREILISSSVAGNIAQDSDVFFMEEVVKNTTIVIATLPILCAYPFAQRYFMRGLMLGSLKE